MKITGETTRERLALDSCQWVPAEAAREFADLIDEMMVLLNDAAVVLPDSYHEGCKQISDVGSRIRAFLAKQP